MTTFYGELAWREQNEEAASLRAIRGSSFTDRLKNNGLPTVWEVKNAKGEIFKINGGYIGSITTVRLCAKAKEIDVDSLVNLTDPHAQTLFTYYPQWLFEKSSKGDLFKMLDDATLQEVMHATELSLRFHIMDNKFRVKFHTGRETFAYKEAYILMAKILIENALMGASAKASNAVVDTRIGKIFEQFLDNETISDTDLRPLLRTELKTLQTKLHRELPEIYHEELNKWSQKVILQGIGHLIAETSESEGEHA